MKYTFKMNRRILLFDTKCIYNKKVPKFMLVLRFLNDTQIQIIIKFGTEKLIDMNLKARKFTPHHINYEIKIHID